MGGRGGRRNRNGGKKKRNKIKRWREKIGKYRLSESCMDKKANREVEKERMR